MEEFEAINKEGDPIPFKDFYLHEGLIDVPPSSLVKIEDRQGRPCLVYEGFDQLQYESTLQGTLWLRAAFVKNNWKAKWTTKGIWEDFYYLANRKASPDDVRSFVLRWGPLWLCTKHPWQDGLPCVASFDIFRLAMSVNKPGINDLCIWRPIEFIDDFLKAIKMIHEVMEVAAYLAQDPSSPLPVPIERFFRTHNQTKLAPPPQVVPSTLSKQKRLFGAIFYKLLHKYQVGHLNFGWWSGDKPQFKLTAGWGFFRAVLLELVGLLTGGYAIYHCDECPSIIYSWQRKRVPKKRSRVLCEDCRRIRSRYSMRRKRERER